MRIEELKQLAHRPIGDLPLNNWSALCQQLGQKGVKIHDLIPFLSDRDRLWELVCCLKSKGYCLTKVEKEIASALGWHNVLVAPMVYDAMCLYRDVSDEKDAEDTAVGRREINIDSKLLWQDLKCYRARNGRDGLDLLSNRAYKLVYNTSLSLSRTFCDISGSPQYRLSRYLDKQLKPITVLPHNESWWNADSEAGYFIMDFATWFEVLSCTEKEWADQEQVIRREHFQRISLQNYVQSLIAYWKINHMVPVEDGVEWVWAVNSPELRVFVKIGVPDPDDKNCMEVVTFEGEGVGCETAVLSGKKFKWIAGMKL